MGGSAPPKGTVSYFFERALSLLGRSASLGYKGVFPQSSWRKQEGFRLIF
jgi:hypothetical protein